MAPFLLYEGRGIFASRSPGSSIWDKGDKEKENESQEGELWIAFTPCT